MILKSCTSDTTEIRHPCVIKVILLLILIFFNLLNLFWHTDKNCCFYAEVNFWDFVRNDNSNKWTTARLNETIFGPKKRSSPINLDTFWCTGWVWNCQIIFRCANIHGRAGFILHILKQPMYRRTNIMNHLFGHGESTHGRMGMCITEQNIFSEV